MPNKASSSRTPLSRKAAGYVYREAARRMERYGTQNGWHIYDYSCTAITGVAGNKYGEPEQFTEPYVEVFAPDDGSACLPETRLQYAFLACCDEARAVRILALCFMAAMTERP